MRLRSGKKGILELLELIGEQKTALRIRHLFLPVWMKGSEKENPFILAAQKAGIMVEYLKKGDEIRAGELTVSVLHPGAGEDYTGEENAGSVVLQLSCGACRALLTGDLEGSGEEEVLGAPDFKGGAPRLEKFNERGISEPHTAADQPDFLRVAGTVRPSAPGAAGAASCLQKPYLRNTGGWSRDSTAEA